MLARPASLHQLLPPHEPAAQLHGTEAKPTKLKTVRVRPPPDGVVRVGPQSWVECPSLCGAMPRGAVPQMLSVAGGATAPSPPRRRLGCHAVWVIVECIVEYFLYNCARPMPACPSQPRPTDARTSQAGCGGWACGRHGGRGSGTSVGRVQGGSRTPQ
jgi:hypothetical protein